jgi:ATP-binding cassette subfamily B protein
LLSQEVALFDGSIRENIYVNQIRSISKEKSEFLNSESIESDQEIIKNLIKFGFSPEKLENEGLDFEIINNGGNLSLGEQQIISLMQALYTKKKIIILDEATSNIDYSSEKKIMDFFYERIKNKTLITVAHRINTVMKCDKIIVLEQGEVVEFGNPQKLLKNPESKFAILHHKMIENLH